MADGVFTIFFDYVCRDSFLYVILLFVLAFGVYLTAMRNSIVTTLNRILYNFIVLGFKMPLCVYLSTSFRSPLGILFYATFSCILVAYSLASLPHYYRTITAQ